MTKKDQQQLKILLYKNKDNVLFSYLIEEILREMIAFGEYGKND